MDATKEPGARKDRPIQLTMVTKDDIPNRRSYILRLWVEDIKDEWVWRFSLEDTFTGERKGFARLEELFTYVQTQLQEGNDD